MKLRRDNEMGLGYGDAGVAVPDGRDPGLMRGFRFLAPPHIVEPTPRLPLLITCHTRLDERRAKGGGEGRPG